MPNAAGFYNAIMYKFSPNWELLAAKLLVDHTEGLAPLWDNGGDTTGV